MKPDSNVWYCLVDELDAVPKNFLFDCHAIIHMGGILAIALCWSAQRTGLCEDDQNTQVWSKTGWNGLVLCISQQWTGMKTSQKLGIRIAIRFSLSLMICETKSHLVPRFIMTFLDEDFWHPQWGCRWVQPQGRGLGGVKDMSSSPLWKRRQKSEAQSTSKWKTHGFIMGTQIVDSPHRTVSLQEGRFLRTYCDRKFVAEICRDMWDWQMWKLMCSVLSKHSTFAIWASTRVQNAGCQMHSQTTDLQHLPSDKKISMAYWRIPRLLRWFSHL